MHCLVTNERREKEKKRIIERKLMRKKRKETKGSFGLKLIITQFSSLIT